VEDNENIKDIPTYTMIIDDNVEGVESITIEFETDENK
jgi:hypothetical protein